MGFKVCLELEHLCIILFEKVVLDSVLSAGGNKKIPTSLPRKMGYIAFRALRHSETHFPKIIRFN